MGSKISITNVKLAAMHMGLTLAICSAGCIVLMYEAWDVKESQPGVPVACWGK